MMSRTYSCQFLGKLGHHRYTSFPKYLKPMPTLGASFLINPNRWDSE